MLEIIFYFYVQRWCDMDFYYIHYNPRPCIQLTIDDFMLEHLFISKKNVWQSQFEHFKKLICSQDSKKYIKCILYLESISLGIVSHR
jgi:hypothetical protein